LQLFDNVISRVRSIGNSTGKETAKQYECFQDVTSFIYVSLIISVRLLIFPKP